jgi:hypothetical protein
MIKRPSVNPETPGPGASMSWSLSMTISGSCLCGAVQYQADGPCSVMIHCHCSMCRKHHGSAFATFVAAPLTGFRWSGGEDSVDVYPSSEKGRRSFCRLCGSIAPTLAAEMDLAILPAGNVEGDLGIRPQYHMFVGSKAPWYTIADSLPQHAEYPPEFGALGMERGAVAPRAGIIEGSCLCGDVAYEITGPALSMWYCHCSRCRRGRSAAHAANVFYSIDDFRFTRGAASVEIYSPPETQHVAVAFCKRCGGAAPRISRERGFVVVPAGSLDVDPGARPQAHIYVASKAGWFEITDDLPQVAEGPA